MSGLILIDVDMKYTWSRPDQVCRTTWTCS